MLRITKQSKLFDLYCLLFYLWERFTGVKYPTRHITRWIRHFSPNLFERTNQDDFKNALKGLVIAGMVYRSSSTENLHQYTRLIDEIHSDPSPDLVTVVTRVARIRYGIVNSDDPDIERMERSIARELNQVA